MHLIMIQVIVAYNVYMPYPFLDSELTVDQKGTLADVISFILDYDYCRLLFPNSSYP